MRNKQISKVKNQLTDAEILHQWMQNLPYKNYNATRARLVSACMVPVDTFRNWMYGKSRIPMLAKREMNKIGVEITGKNIFEIEAPTSLS